MAYTNILYHSHEYILKVENGRNIIKPEAEKDVKNLIVNLIFEDKTIKQH